MGCRSKILSFLIPSCFFRWEVYFQLGSNFSIFVLLVFYLKKLGSMVSWDQGRNRVSAAKLHVKLVIIIFLVMGLRLIQIKKKVNQVIRFEVIEKTTYHPIPLETKKNKWKTQWAFVVVDMWVYCLLPFKYIHESYICL